MTDDRTFPEFDAEVHTLAPDAMIAVSDDQIVSLRELIGAWRVLSAIRPDPSVEFSAYQLVRTAEIL